MDPFSLLLAVGLALLVGAFIARPLLAPHTPAPAHSHTAQLNAEHESLLIALRELDFDHSTGKVADEDYAQQRAALVARGVALLQQLDEQVQALAPSAEEQLEAEVRTARARLSATTPACPNCGAPRQPTDRFCAKCGASLTGAA